MTMPTPGGDSSGGQPAYVDPITGQPLYLDPVTGQLSYGTAAPSPTTAQLPADAPLRPATPVVAYVPGQATPHAPGVTAEPTPESALAEYVPTAASGIPSGYPAGPTPTGYPAGYPAMPAGYAYPIGFGPYGAPARTNGMAIASLVVSISSLSLLACYGLGAVVGLVGAILGHVARRQTRQRNETGGGMALAGIICGWISVAVGVVIVGFIVWIFTYFRNAPYYDE